MSNNNTVRVWDIWVRLFHWSLVAMFVVAYFTAEEENIFHIYSGYAVLGLIIFRILWGFIGSQHARFSDFVFGPGKVIQYARGLLAGKPEHYLGHNPLGGWMVVALLIALFVVSVSGLKVYAIEEGRGPLAGSEHGIIINYAYADRDDDDDEDEEHEYNKKNHDEGDEDEEEEFWEEIHEISTNVTLGLIALHILGVIVSGRLHRENLVKAMITGNKQKPLL